MKSILYVFRHSAWQGRSALDGLDALMASCAMELQVSALFLHEGVLILKQDQMVSTSLEYAPKLASKPFKALFDFGCESIFVCERSLQARSLSSNDLFIATQSLNRDSIAQLIADHDQVLVF